MGKKNLQFIAGRVNATAAVVVCLGRCGRGAAASHLFAFGWHAFNVRRARIVSVRVASAVFGHDLGGVELGRLLVHRLDAKEAMMLDARTPQRLAVGLRAHQERLCALAVVVVVVVVRCCRFDAVLVHVRVVVVVLVVADGQALVDEHAQHQLVAAIGEFADARPKVAADLGAAAAHHTTSAHSRQAATLIHDDARRRQADQILHIFLVLYSC